MITSKIAANQAFMQTNRLTKSEEFSGKNNGAEEAMKVTNGDEVDGIKAEISTFSTHPMQQFNAEFNTVAKSIRIADKAMGEIETNIEQMESEVEMFLKQYPPYPPGSEERINYLNRFAMLRKQIDQLTMPPDAGAEAIIGRASNGQKTNWDIEIGGRAIGKSIRRQPMHTGKEGLNLPEITPQATDEHVFELKNALGSARQQVKRGRSEFAEDAIQVIKSVE
jgi:hypothetical protein